MGSKRGAIIGAAVGGTAFGAFAYVAREFIHVIPEAPKPPLSWVAYFVVAGVVGGVVIGGVL